MNLDSLEKVLGLSNMKSTRKVACFISALAVAAFAFLSAGPAEATPTVTQIPVAGWSEGLAQDGTYVYASLLDSSKVIRIDPTSNAVLATYNLAAGSQPYEMVIVNGYLYTANFWNMSNTAPGTVSRINLATGEVVAAWATISNGFKAEWIAANNDYIVVSGQGGKIAQIPISDPSSPVYYTLASVWTSDLVVIDNYAYVAIADNSGLGGVTRVNLSNGHVDNQWVNLGKTIGIAKSGDYLFAGSWLDHTISKISTSSGTVVATSAPAADSAWLITIGGGKVYGTQLTGGVATFDVDTLTLEGDPYVSTGSQARDSLPFAGTLWITGHTDNKVYRLDLSVIPTLSPSTQTPPAAKVGNQFSTPALTANHFSSSVTYSIYPELPAGLSLNPETGAITGTPTASASSRTYTITANGTDILTSTITFEVQSDSQSSLAATGSDWTSTVDSGLAIFALGALFVASKRLKVLFSKSAPKHRS